MENLPPGIEKVFDANPITIYGISLFICLLWIVYLARQVSIERNKREESHIQERKTLTAKKEESIIDAKVLIQSNQALNKKIQDLIDTLQQSFHQLMK